MRKTLFFVTTFIGMACFSAQAEDDAEMNSWKKEESLHCPCREHKKDHLLAEADSISDALNKLGEKHNNDLAKCGRKPCHCHV